MAFIALPGVRNFVARFGTYFLYLTRIWVGQTDWRDFYHRRQVPRALCAAVVEAGPTAAAGLGP